MHGLLTWQDREEEDGIPTASADLGQALAINLNVLHFGILKREWMQVDHGCAWSLLQTCTAQGAGLAEEEARLFHNHMVKYFGLPKTLCVIVIHTSQVDLLFNLIGPELKFSTAKHPQIDSQAEKINYLL